MTTYKLLRLRKNGTLGPLFIEASRVLELGVVQQANCTPTKGYAIRPGFHSTWKPEAPHLDMKGRVWVECTVPGEQYTKEQHQDLFDTRNGMSKLPSNGWYLWPRPANQGGIWIISDQLRLNRILSTEEVQEICNAK
jgi:hypothetical protein